MEFWRPINCNYFRKDLFKSNKVLLLVHYWLETWSKGKHGLFGKQRYKRLMKRIMIKMRVKTVKKRMMQMSYTLLRSLNKWRINPWLLWPRSSLILDWKWQPFKSRNGVGDGGSGHKGSKFTKKTSYKTWSVDKSKIRYFNCNELSHFATECKSPKKVKKDKILNLKKSMRHYSKSNRVKLT